MTKVGAVAAMNRGWCVRWQSWLSWDCRGVRRQTKYAKANMG